ncbi:TetR/AcrR family transcriptional regulator [Amycolatopsis thermalba]|uniref:TetR/AcrR family transcriptional regulator n=1 Tax=Amycolatopsis thermalba TaxID=944492 RepID=A0ABY4NTQ1_9PSEU|nr:MULTISPECIES: TetR/AcrR family transcriptional regulator [Amycolatopsis]UQS23437.1 TetR/AcrR family transcriptional regulator [Amycolatopsis thermalba]
MVVKDERTAMTSDHGRTLELLWGGGERPARGPKPALSVDKIVRAAIDLADKEGIDAVSMQRVAAAVGKTTMSLYRYVSGKDQLVELMMDYAAEDAPPVPAGQDWRADVVAWVRAVWALLERHPWILRIPLHGPPSGPRQLAWLEAGLRAMSGLGLTGGEMIAAMTFLDGAVRELARLGLDMSEAQREAGVTTQEADADFAAALRRFVDPVRFPTLASTVADGTFDPEPGADTSVLPDLEFGVQRLLDGLEAYARRRET